MIAAAVRSEETDIFSIWPTPSDDSRVIETVLRAILFVIVGVTCANRQFACIPAVVSLLDCQCPLGGRAGATCRRRNEPGELRFGSAALSASLQRQAANSLINAILPFVRPLSLSLCHCVRCVLIESRKQKRTGK